MFIRRSHIGTLGLLNPTCVKRSNAAFATSQGLVLSCGSAPGSQKSVYGSKQTLANLSEAMNGGLWPVLGSYTEGQGVPYVWRLYVWSSCILHMAESQETAWSPQRRSHRSLA